ncbi:hypothetical protein ACQKWADRAFT_151506 [Trichoderma austrokoningii]
MDDTSHDNNPPPSFSSRRPAAGTLPTFSLPPPQPEVSSIDDQSSRPRTFYNLGRSIDLNPPPAGTSDGLSPSLSSVHTSSSQGSQAAAPASMQQYTYSGHVHGSWPTPSNSAYSVSTGSAPQQQPGPLQTQTPGASSYPANPANGTQPPLATAAPYGGGGRSSSSMYGGGTGLPYGNQRSSQSPANTGGDGLAAAQQQYEHHSFQPAAGQDGGHSGSLMAAHVTQAPGGSNNSSAHVDSYTHSRPSYSSSSAPQHASSNFPYATHPGPASHSPTGAASLPRGLGSLSSQQPLPSMAHPGSYRPYQAYPHMSNMGGPVMSNIHQPGSQLAMIPGMVPAGYGASAMMYQHPPPQPQSERPFKCDQCVQSFSRNHDLKRHKRIHLAVKPFPCTFCSKSFSRKDALKRHRLVKGCENKSHETQAAGENGSSRGGEADDDSRRN